MFKSGLMKNSTLKVMPFPINDVSEAIKNEKSPAAVEGLQKMLAKIQTKVSENALSRSPQLQKSSSEKSYSAAPVPLLQLEGKKRSSSFSAKLQCFYGRTYLCLCHHHEDSNSCQTLFHLICRQVDNATCTQVQTVWNRYKESQVLFDDVFLSLTLSAVRCLENWGHFSSSTVMQWVKKRSQRSCRSLNKTRNNTTALHRCVMNFSTTQSCRKNGIFCHSIFCFSRSITAFFSATRAVNLSISSCLSSTSCLRA